MSTEQQRTGGNYEYVTSRVRSRRAALFDDDDYRKLVRMGTGEIARFMEDSEYEVEMNALGSRYAGVDLIEYALNRNLAKHFEDLLRWSEGALYDYVEREASLLDRGELLFYSGSPHADIVVVSEAPTWSEAGSETFYSMTVALAERGVSTDDLCAFWRAYPFTDDLTQFGFPGESRHRLYRQYVETFLSFVDDPEASIGFADVVKRPLDEGEDLRDALAGPYEYGLALRRQLEFVDPAVVVALVGLAGVMIAGGDRAGFVPPSENTVLDVGTCRVICCSITRFGRAMKLNDGLVAGRR